MRHHFVNSERLALRAYVELRKQNLIPTSDEFCDMDSKVVSEGKWSTEEPWEWVERTVKREINFRFDNSVAIDEVNTVRVTVIGREKRHNRLPNDSLPGEPSRTFWRLGKIEIELELGSRGDGKTVSGWKRLRVPTSGRGEYLRSLREDPTPCLPD